MDVITALPFKFCDTCPRFDMDVNCEELVIDSMAWEEKRVSREIKITCKNYKMCMGLFKELRHDMDGSTAVERG